MYVYIYTKRTLNNLERKYTFFYYYFRYIQLLFSFIFLMVVDILVKYFPKKAKKIKSYILFKMI